jgi:hypothetical protein
VSRALRRIATALAVLAGAPLSGGLAYAAFVATTSNGGNTFSAAACFNTQRMATGSYTGDAVDDRAISTGFQPDLVFVKADTAGAEVAMARTSSMSGDASKSMFGNFALITDRIQSLTGTGFTVGASSQVNQAGTTYRWAAFKSGCGTLKVGSYAGNGAATQAISGLGFQPEAVIVMSAAANYPMHRFSGMTRSFRFEAHTGSAAVINSLDTNGFTVGNAPEANANGTTYHYVAFNDVAGSVNKGSYTGNNVDNRNINTVGFQPAWMMIRANDTGTARAGHHRPASLGGTNSQFWSNTANSNNGIQALLANGFQLGTDPSVNANGPTYHYLALRNTSN